MEKGKVLKLLIYFLAALLFANLVLLIYFSLYSEPRGFLKAIFLDIGQGDAILIKKGGKNILIDAGPDKGIIYKLDKHLPFNKREIDLAILTHPDPDHLNGFLDVLENFKVKKIITNGGKDNSSAYLLFEKMLEEKGLEPLEVKAPLKINFEDDFFFDFFWPEETPQFPGDNNYFSLVFKMTFDKISFLFTGDATEETEKELLQNYDLKAQVLKVGHHGSKNSSSFEFLKAVEPQFAVISCGKNNRFGHPDSRVIEDLEKIGAQIFRTDKSGDIILETDGELIKSTRSHSEIWLLISQKVSGVFRGETPDNLGGKRDRSIFRYHFSL